MFTLFSRSTLSRVTAVFLGAAVACFSTGCESGHEVAGVGSATAARQSNGDVQVTATLTCLVAWGQPRVDGKCDADGTNVCVDAKWSPASDSSTQIGASRICQHVDHIIGATVQLTSSSSIPTTPSSNILLSTDDQPTAEDTSLRSVVIASP
jgi:hypothetical protein